MSVYDQIKSDLGYRNNRFELASAMFECVEVFHNRQRRHSSTPIEYEKIQQTKNGMTDPTIPRSPNWGHIRASTNLTRFNPSHRHWTPRAR